MIQISVVQVQFRVLGPGEHVGWALLLRRNGEPWLPQVELGVFTVKEKPFVDLQWTAISTLNWREVQVTLAKIMLRERDDIRYAALRAVSPTPAAVLAQVNNLDAIGKACAEYVWEYADLVVGGNSRMQAARIDVNEQGGMCGGATFQGIAPYPVPGYDLAWTDDSLGG